MWAPTFGVRQSKSPSTGTLLVVSATGWKPCTTEHMLHQILRNDLTSRWIAFPRFELFVVLFILACANGVASKMILSVHRLGWTDAVFATFDISVIALFSCVAGISLVLRNKIDEVRPTDIAISAVLLLLI